MTRRRLCPRAAATCVALVLAATAGSAACSSDSDSGRDVPPAAGAGTAPATDPAAQPGAGVRLLDPAAFAAVVKQAGIVLLDVRTPEEFASGHLAGATNLDMQAADFADKLAALDRSKSYAIYCRSGNRSGVVAGQMRAAGFASVADLNGGILAWQSAGHPLVTA